MSKAVVYMGADPTEDDAGELWGEWDSDEDVTDVTVAKGVTEIKKGAFYGCTGLTHLCFLKGSAITTVGWSAFDSSGIITLQGMERVRKIGLSAFRYCVNLRTIEGLSCKEMGDYCFAFCTLLNSMKGWPASMTVIPACCFRDCTGMTTVDCDLAHVTSIGLNAFWGCTSLLPPSLSKKDANPAAVLTYLKEMASNEREAARNAALAAEQDAERAAQAAEDSLLAELDAEDAAKKGGKKKKKKKKTSGKKGTQQAEPADWRSDFQRYVQSDMMRGVDQRKRQRNLEEAARIMAAHEQKIAALRLPPSLDPASPAPPAPPDALAETMEDIEAQIAALGLPPDFSPAPPPAAAPDAFLESLLASPPPAPHQSRGASLKESVAELHSSVFGAAEPLPPPDNYLLALLEKLPPDKAREIVEFAHSVVQR